MIKYLSLFIAFFKSDLFLPFVLLSIYLIFLVVARGTIPTSEELVDAFALFYARYGLEIIFVSALLEALVLINFFAPGQLTMALGIIFARSGQTDLIEVIAVVVAGALTGYLIDFLLGYFGFSDILKRLGYQNLVNQSKTQLNRFGKRGLILGFVHSSIASFVSLAAGTARLNFLTFAGIAIVATLFWTILWSLLIYTFGDIFLIIIKRYGFLLVAFGLAGLFLSNIWKGEEKKVKN